MDPITGATVVEVTDLAVTRVQVSPGHVAAGDAVRCP
jgi:hypothetical protein